MSERKPPSPFSELKQARTIWMILLMAATSASGLGDGLVHYFRGQASILFSYPWSSAVGVQPSSGQDWYGSKIDRLHQTELQRRSAPCDVGRSCLASGWKIPLRACHRCSNNWEEPPTLCLRLLWQSCHSKARCQLSTFSFTVPAMGEIELKQQTYVLDVAAACTKVAGGGQVGSRERSCFVLQCGVCRIAGNVSSPLVCLR